MPNLRKQLVEKLEAFEGLVDRPSTVAGGSAIFYHGREIAHFHNDNEIDVRLTKKIIKREGLSHPTDSEVHHHRSANSQWIELRFSRAEHLDEVVRLFKLALEQY